MRDGSMSALADGLCKLSKGQVNSGLTTVGLGFMHLALRDADPESGDPG